jgi:predicted flap endonuclease-1-like 5' DNA nuclease
MGLATRELRGMVPEVQQVLRMKGLTDTLDFLSAASTPQLRKGLASESGVDAGVILALANRADLARIDGVGAVFSDLLEEAGVDTVKELARRNPENLYDKLASINAARQTSARIPSLEAIKSFIDQATELTPILTY